MRKRKPVEERLWPRVQIKGPDDCWLWTGGTSGKGYGSIGVFVGGKKVSGYAHREALRLSKGEPPDADSQALHSCDTPSCCNPKHLSWGNNAKNRKEARDRLHNQGNQKLIPEQVADIRTDPRTHVEIAKTYAVHPDTVARIKQGRSWLQ